MTDTTTTTDHDNSPTEPPLFDPDARLDAARVWLDDADSDGERAEVIADLIRDWLAAWPDSAVTDPYEVLAAELVRLLAGPAADADGDQGDAGQGDANADVLERAASVRIDTRDVIWHPADHGRWQHPVYGTLDLDQIEAEYGKTCAALLVPVDEDQAAEQGPPKPGRFCTRHWSWLCQAGQGECAAEQTAGSGS